MFRASPLAGLRGHLNRPFSRTTSMQYDNQDIESAVHYDGGKPPRGLASRIIKTIHAEQQLALSRRRAAYFSIALAGSVTALVISFMALCGAVLSSELPRLLSLLFSDPQAVTADWQDFSLFFFESLPVLSLVAFLVASFCLLESLRRSARYFSAIFSSSRLVKHN
jgi:hypothetical protein